MASTHLIVSSPWMENKPGIQNKLLFKGQTRITEKAAKIAGNELREDENSRNQCLQQLRDWIKKNQDIENCRTDDKFLLRFLRVKKFSILMAEQTLLKYLNFRKRFKHFMCRLDYLENPLIDKGYIFVSPFRDSNGRRVILYNLSKVNPHEFSGRDICHAHAITYETLLDDEENQILGINHVADLKGLNAAFLTLWTVNEFATIVRWGEQSVPMRHKEVHILNFPMGLRYVYEFVQSNIKNQKLKERMLIHDSLSELHKKVSKTSLPLELGGLMPMEEMVQLWKEELATKRKILLSYDTMNLLSDKGIICKRNSPTSDDTGISGLPGSFRKLEVD